VSWVGRGRAGAGFYKSCRGDDLMSARPVPPLKEQQKFAELQGAVEKKDSGKVSFTKFRRQLPQRTLEAFLRIIESDNQHCVSMSSLLMI